jgi:cytochrome c553
MNISSLLVVLFLLPLPQQAPPAPAGNPERGKVLWQKTEHVECRECHGVNGEGAFGPDLAGRKLTPAQFIHAVRKPWGIMPAFTDKNITDPELMDLIAYFDTLPSVAEPGPWRVKVPEGASRGLAASITSGCVQCHAATFNNGRAIMGAIDANFEWFKSIVYVHTVAYPPTRVRLGEPPYERMAMGHFSVTRLPESTLQDVWSYIVDLGFRPKLRGQLSGGVPSTGGVVYTLDVENTGLVGKGRIAEEVTVNLAVPAGATVVAATGPGYQGVRRDERAKADMAVWTVPRLAPGDHQTYTLTLSQAATAKDNLRGTIRWVKPKVTTDSEAIAPAPLGVQAR